MEKSSGLYLLVYDFYEARIRFGFYRYGDCLPSISHICGTFHLGRATVRAALALLETDGYIENRERRAAGWSIRRIAGGMLKTPGITTCPERTVWGK